MCVSAGTAEIVIGYRFGLGPTMPERFGWSCGVVGGPRDERPVGPNAAVGHEQARLLAEQEGISINQLIATSLAGDERSSAIVVHRRPAVPSVRETLRSDHARDRTLNRSMWRLDQMAAASPNTSPTRR